jgi:DNA modification methylase
MVPSGRNRRSVWTIPTHAYPGAHFATFPPKLIEPCIMAGCPEGGTVLDPFLGSGTTATVAERVGVDSIGTELSPDYVALALERMTKLGCTCELVDHDQTERRREASTPD